MIHLGYDGSDHHRIKLHNPLGRVMLIFIYLFIHLFIHLFIAMLPSSHRALLTRESISLFDSRLLHTPIFAPPIH